MSLVVTGMWLRAAWTWCRKHALAIVAGLAAIGGLVAYLLGRRSSRDDTDRARDVGAAQGRAEVHDTTAAEHRTRADAARDEQRDLERAQDAAERAAAEKRAEAERMSAEDVSRATNELLAARYRRQREREAR